MDCLGSTNTKIHLTFFVKKKINLFVFCHKVCYTDVKSKNSDGYAQMVRFEK